MKRKDWIRYIIISILVLFTPIVWLFRKLRQKDIPVGRTYHEVCFEPFDFPQKDINEHSLLACLSPDKKSLIISYSYGDKWQANLCIGDISVPSNPVFQLVASFRPETLITSLGLSSKNEKETLQTTCTLRSYPPQYIQDDNLCDESLYRICLDNNKMVENGITRLMPLVTYYRKKSFQANKLVTPHLWFDANSTLLFVSYLGIIKYEQQKVEENTDNPNKPNNFCEIYHVRDSYNANTGPFICSNLCDMEDGTVQFLEAPPSISQDMKDFGSRDGNLVTMDITGKVVSRRNFPTLPYGRMAFLTKNYWCFSTGISQRKIVFAPLKNPEQFHVIEFPEHQIIDNKNSKVSYYFKVFGLLSDNQTLLCTRAVTSQSFDEAKKSGNSLCELGLVKLPMDIS